MIHKTQRTEPFFHKWLEDLNFLFQICLIEITFFFFWKKRCLEELIFWKYQSNYTNFILMTQRIELFFFLKKKKLIEIELFSHDSKNWTLFWIWLKELKKFHDFLTQRIEPFLNMTRKSEIFLECDSQNWTFLLTQRNEFLFSEWQRFCWIRLKESNLCLNMSPRIEPFLEFHSMDWTLCTKGLKELDPKKIIWTTKPSYELGNLFDLKNWNFSHKYHSKIIDLFWHDSQNRTPF